MAKALGIIAYNDSSVYVEGMQSYRPIAAFNFMGRFRMVDFPMSNITNSGMDNIQVYINGNPKPLFKHIGRGRQYNINAKHGNLELVPLYKENMTGRITPDVETYYENLHSIQASNCDYVIIAPTNIIYQADYAELLDQHIESGADISILYQNIDNAKEEYIGCATVQLNRQKGVESLSRNMGKYKNRSLSLETYIMSKEIFVNAILEARKTSALYWLRDIVNDLCSELDVRGISYRNKIYYVYDLKSFYQANMATLEPENMKQLQNWSVYTRSYDSSPAIYPNGGNATNSYVSNSSKISGTVVNSIIGRGAVIGKDAEIENCLIMPEATVAANAHLKNVIVDKYANIIHKKDLEGEPDKPLYIGRRETV
ncbi:MAG: glucose-1-phosphate adenylyltransferase subunit GlgD [Absicoccus porci]|uniref:glucose-1-phosphate adenylyltransferase subunit GlgD n=1 Tax=Absicoccus porci TaxID=2486576 RepID=UPI002E7A7E8D|nr:glucose-1-phosphate adenylyltransferase subunit GlgD [Absicoccus porci]MEE1354470.1 glucose-1-phosphate adenylyltransferase subunit GlgD [Absicoccus porci]